MLLPLALSSKGSHLLIMTKFPREEDRKTDFSVTPAKLGFQKSLENTGFLLPQE
jgi:hypothetical protein